MSPYITYPSFMLFVYVFVAIFAGATALTHVIIVTGIIRSRLRENIPSQPTDIPHSLISIIIPAHNEEKNLPFLLESLKKQTDSHFEVIFINDRSTDSTKQIIENFQKNHSFPVHIISLSKNPHPVNPKQFALEKGIAAAHGNFYLFTDADCILPPHWVEYYRNAFSESTAGVIFGPVYTVSGKGFLKKYQTFDHVYRYHYTVGSAGMGIPSGGFGNNLAVRRKALDAIGGYGTVDYSVTEDAALITAINKRTGYCIRALTSSAVTVQAHPQKSWKNLVRQELRWSSGAFFSPYPETRGGYSAVMLYLAGGVFALPFIPFVPVLSWISISTFCSMFSVAFSGGLLLRLKPREYWLYVIQSILFSGIMYLYVDALALFRAKITWKGHTLEAS